MSRVSHRELVDFGENLARIFGYVIVIGIVPLMLFVHLVSKPAPPDPDRFTARERACMEGGNFWVEGKCRATPDTGDE